MAKGRISSAVDIARQRKQRNRQAHRAQQADEAAAAGISIWDIRQAAWKEVKKIRKAGGKKAAPGERTRRSKAFAAL